MKTYLVIIFSLLSIQSFGQEEDLVKYLEAYKTAEFEESKEVISNYSFGQSSEYTISEYSTFNGIAFTADTSTVKGFKAIGNCKVKNKAGGFIDKRMMVVMYFDKIQKHWSVFSFREVADSKYEYETVKAHIDKGDFYTYKEFVYRNAAYWAIMAGKIIDGKKYLELALEAAKQSTSKIPFSTDNIDIVLTRIM